MHEKIDFGTIGIKIGDIITFQPANEKYMVGSGNGTPGNGGTLLIDPKNKSLSSLLFVTKYLLDEEFNYNIDIFQLWYYKGQSLRALHNYNLKNVTNE